MNTKEVADNLAGFPPKAEVTDELGTPINGIMLREGKVVLLAMDADPEKKNG